MPFDPNIVREEDAGFEGDLKLPDDLALMAEQLGDDATRLAATYPPPVPRSRTEHCSVPRPAPHRTSWLTRSLAGTALAAGLVTISLVASNSYRPQDANHPLPATASPVSRALVVNEKASTPTSTEPQKIPVTPASWLGDTSGPELEALMDLWEQDQPTVRSLSF